MEIFLLCSYRSIRQHTVSIPVISQEKVEQLVGKTCDVVVSRLACQHQLSPVFVAQKSQPSSRPSNKQELLVTSVFQSSVVSLDAQGNIAREKMLTGYQLTNLRYFKQHGRYIVTVQNGETVNLFRRGNLQKIVHQSAHKLDKRLDNNIEGIGSWITGNNEKILFINTQKEVVQIVLGSRFPTKVLMTEAADVQLYAGRKPIVLKTNGDLVDLGSQFCYSLPRPKKEAEIFTHLRVIGHAAVALSYISSNQNHYQARYTNTVTLVDLLAGEIRDTLVLGQETSVIRSIIHFTWNKVGFLCFTSKSNLMTICAFSRSKIMTLMHSKMPAGMDAKISYPAENITGCCHLSDNKFLITTDKSKLCMAELYWPSVIAK